MSGNSIRNTEDQRLAEAVKQGSQRSLALLYDKYASVLYGVICRITDQKELSEEILRITFIKIWKQRTSFNPSAIPVLTYLINLSRFTAYEEIKNMKIKQETKTQTPHNSVCEYSKNNIEGLLFEESVEKEAFDLIFNKGLSYQEAATELKIPVEGLKSIVRSAVKSLNEVKIA